MAKISTEQKLDNIRNMRAMIKDYSKIHNRYPTNKEMEEKLGFSEATVKRYKHTILDEIKKELITQFNEDIIIHVNGAITEINKNITLFKKIRDNSDNEDTKMAAAKNIEEAHLDIVRIMSDAPQYINNDIAENEQEYIHGSEEAQQRTTDSIKSMFD